MLPSAVMPHQETWPGGYVHRDGQGRPTYVIRRRIDGRRYKVSTRRRTLAAAMAELERFERNPAGYRPTESDRLLLDGELVVAYLEACREKGNSLGWMLAKRDLLIWWGEQLEGVELRRLDVQAVERALEGGPRRMHRIEAIKHLMTWCVRTGRMEADPLRDRLQVPAARPAQAHRVKAFPQSTHRTWMSALPPSLWRDGLAVLAATGWHVTELERFAEGGAADEERSALRQPLTKGGLELKVEVGAEALAAGKRILAVGSLSHWSLRQYVKRFRVKSAHEGVALPPLPIGSYRHSVATWAIDAGTEVAAVSDFLGHKSPRTTRRFYATHSVIPKPKGIG